MDRESRELPRIRRLTRDEREARRETRSSRDIPREFWRPDHFVRRLLPEPKGVWMLFPEESYRIMGACFAVHNSMGSGYLEAVYQVCLAIEFDLQTIPFVSHPQLVLSDRGRELKQKYCPDFVCFGAILVEIKAVNRLADQHRAQIMNYLSATKMPLGILVNFAAHPKLEYQRIAMTEGNLERPPD